MKNKETKERKEEKEEIKEIKFRWFENDPDDWIEPIITHFGHPEIKHHLHNPDELVIKDQEIKILFSYPLETSVERDYHAIGGFSRMLLGQCVFEGYCEIYEEEDLEIYGVWGHEMGNLSLLSVEYVVEKKLCMLSIES